MDAASSLETGAGAGVVSVTTVTRATAEPARVRRTGGAASVASSAGTAPAVAWPASAGSAATGTTTVGCRGVLDVDGGGEGGARRGADDGCGGRHRLGPCRSARPRCRRARCRRTRCRCRCRQARRRSARCRRHRPACPARSPAGGPCRPGSRRVGCRGGRCRGGRWRSRRPWRSLNRPPPEPLPWLLPFPLAGPCAGGAGTGRWAVPADARWAGSAGASRLTMTPRPLQHSHCCEKASSSPAPTRLRVIWTRPSEVTSATWCLVRSLARHSSSRRSTSSRLDSSTMSMKSMTTMPPTSRSRSWRTISSAASRLFLVTVSSRLPPWPVNFPVLTSTTVIASVRSMTSEPPLGSQTLRSSALASCSSMR